MDCTLPAYIIALGYATQSLHKSIFLVAHLTVGTNLYRNVGLPLLLLRLLWFFHISGDVQSWI
jgi:hypothetical protein